MIRIDYHRLSILTIIYHDILYTHITKYSNKFFINKLFKTKTPTLKKNQYTIRYVHLQKKCFINIESCTIEGFMEKSL